MSWCFLKTRSTQTWTSLSCCYHASTFGFCCQCCQQRKGRYDRMKNGMSTTEDYYNALQQLQRTYIDVGPHSIILGHLISDMPVFLQREVLADISFLIQNTRTEGQCVDWERHTGIYSFFVGCTFLTRMRKTLESHQCSPQNCFQLLKRENHGPRDTAHSPCADCTCYTPASCLILEGRCYISHAQVIQRTPL